MFKLQIAGSTNMCLDNILHTVSIFVTAATTAPSSHNSANTAKELVIEALHGEHTKQLSFVLQRLYQQYMYLCEVTTTLATAKKGYYLKACITAAQRITWHWYARAFIVANCATLDNALQLSGIDRTACCKTQPGANTACLQNIDCTAKHSLLANQRLLPSISLLQIRTVSTNCRCTNGSAIAECIVVANNNELDGPGRAMTGCCNRIAIALPTVACLSLRTCTD